MPPTSKERVKTSTGWKEPGRVPIQPDTPLRNIPAVFEEALGRGL